MTHDKFELKLKIVDSFKIGNSFFARVIFVSWRIKKQTLLNLMYN